ncbi:hypothetical protein HHI36_019552 [Cryptolaemus montrouzieri]|uniref:Uncharacterized protein n=1 Tax=Cryptolaemus montrouzieri TaxID=559131 RepID=A0ABD2N965_9CUCU
MHFNLVFAVVILSVASLVRTVPLSPPQTQQELIDDFAKFLKEDKEVALALKKLDFEELKSRSRRDAIDDGMMDVETISGDKNPSQEGFFDRAAKFVMEVLQRFLKWINTDN